MKEPKTNLVTRREEVDVIDDQATGTNMRRLRWSLDLSLRRVAKELSWSPSYLSDLELGKRAWTADKVALVEKTMRNLKQ